MFVYTLGDIFGLVIFCLTLLVVGIKLLSDYVRTLRCKHERYHENMACHAICRGCGKDLGFVETWRDKVAAKKCKG